VKQTKISQSGLATRKNVVDQAINVAAVLTAAVIDKLKPWWKGTLTLVEVGSATSLFSRHYHV
jgi:hypothetical protein